MTKWTYLPSNYRASDDMDRLHMIGNVYEEKGVQRVLAMCDDKVVDAPLHLFAEGWLTLGEAAALAKQRNLYSKAATYEPW